MIRYGVQRAHLNYGLGASGLRGPKPKCKSINQSSTGLTTHTHTTAHSELREAPLKTFWTSIIYHTVLNVLFITKNPIMYLVLT